MARLCLTYEIVFACTNDKESAKLAIFNAIFSLAHYDLSYINCTAQDREKKSTNKKYNLKTLNSNFFIGLRVNYYAFRNHQIPRSKLSK